MKSVLALTFASAFATLAPASSTFHSPIIQPLLKRGYQTCAQTYGGGSITCGDINSLYCYDPTLGETCCLLDEGYCKAGDFCAAVAGFCCHDGEDPLTCAIRQSFTLPAPFSTPTTAALISSSSAVVTPTATSLPLLPTATDIADAIDISAAAEPTSVPQTTTRTSTVHVQVLAIDTSSPPTAHGTPASFASIGVTPPTLSTAIGTKPVPVPVPDSTAAVTSTGASAGVSASVGSSASSAPNAGFVQFGSSSEGAKTVSRALGALGGVAAVVVVLL